MTPDDRLKTLFAADLPPTRDPDFQARVLARMMKVQFMRELAAVSAASLAGGAALALMWPSLWPVLSAVSRSLSPAAIGMVVAASILALSSTRTSAFLLG